MRTSVCLLVAALAVVATMTAASARQLQSEQKEIKEVPLSRKLLQAFQVTQLLDIRDTYKTADIPEDPNRDFVVIADSPKIPDEPEEETIARKFVNGILAALGGLVKGSGEILEVAIEEGLSS